MSEVIKNLELFINSKLTSALVEGVTDMCMDIRNKAVQNCPIDDGPLRASITIDVQPVTDGIEGAVGTNKEYAIYVHEGTGLYAKSGNGRKEVPWTYKDAEGNWHSTKGQKPKPFLQDAVDEIIPNILKYFEGVLK